MLARLFKSLGMPHSPQKWLDRKSVFVYFGLEGNFSPCTLRRHSMVVLEGELGLGFRV